MMTPKSIILNCLLLSGLCLPVARGESPSAPIPAPPPSKALILQKNVKATPSNRSSSRQYVQGDYDVRRFLEEAPPLKKVVFGIDASTFLGVKESETNAAAKVGKLVFYEGAWQRGTFYNRLLERPGKEFSGEPKGSAMGLSSDGLYWGIEYAHADGAITAVDKNDPAVDKSRAGQRGKLAMEKLDGVRSLWINLLLPGTLKWIDEDHFQAKLKKVPAARTSTPTQENVLTGTITARDSEGRPTRIDYGWPGLKGKGELWKEFLYTAPVGKTKLPNIVVGGSRYVPESGDPVVMYRTNVLEQIDIGMDNMDALGYVPGMFLLANGTNISTPYITYQSNNVTYEIVNGVMKEQAKEFVPKEFQKKRLYRIAIVILVVLIPLFWKYGAKIFRGKNQQST